MLRDEMELYSNLTGEDATHVPIMKIGAYLDGYEKGLSILEDIKAEIEKAKWIDKDTRLVRNCNASGLDVALEIIDKHMESEDNK